MRTFILLTALIIVTNALSSASVDVPEICIGGSPYGWDYHIVVGPSADAGETVTYTPNPPGIPEIWEFDFSTCSANERINSGEYSCGGTRCGCP